VHRPTSCSREWTLPEENVWPMLQVVSATLWLALTCDLAAAELPAEIPRTPSAKSMDTSLTERAKFRVLAQSRESLFGDDLPKAIPEGVPSRESLFGDDQSRTKPRLEAKQPGVSPEKTEESWLTSGWRGYVETALAYTYREPEHWSKARTRLELGRQGRISESLRYKLTGWFSYDADFDIDSGFYPSDVRQNRRFDAQVRETYLDIAPGGDWEFRLGRQHIVWGEVPGLFFADVVSAKDVREFLLQEFDALRIPQWAVRADYYHADFHFEVVWIPAPTVDRIGKPGDDFYPYPPVAPGFVPGFKTEQKPDPKLENSNFGMRASVLANGWDLSAFVYRSYDNEPAFYREVVAGPVPTFVYEPRHERITQYGGTVTKDLGPAVFKAEVVYTHDRAFSVQGVSDVDGIAKLNLVDYLLGLDFSFGGDTRLNTYVFQRRFTDYHGGVVPDRTESGITMLLSHKLSSTLEVQALLVSSSNRSDWMFRPKATWNFAKNWRANIGADILHGPPLGFFGRFDNSDRIYAEIRYSF
jgi:hypothetical protein